MNGETYCLTTNDGKKTLFRLLRANSLYLFTNRLNENKERKDRNFALYYVIPFNRDLKKQITLNKLK